jgi:hypothetical protein
MYPLWLILGTQSLASAFLHTPCPRQPSARLALSAGRLTPSVRRGLDVGRGALGRPLQMTATDPRTRATFPVVQTPEVGSSEGVVRYYDTTLRDGAQGEGISLSCDDKLRIAARLSKFGADYIEAGWPGSNPKDAEFFQRAQGELNAEAFSKVVAFGSTRYKNIKVEDDKQVQMLVDSNARVVTLVGKSWDLHVDEVGCCASILYMCKCACANASVRVAMYRCLRPRARRISA